MEDEQYPGVVALKHRHSGQGQFYSSMAVFLEYYKRMNKTGRPRYSRKEWKMKKEIEKTMANGEVRLTMTEIINEFNQREPE